MNEYTTALQATADEINATIPCRCCGQHSLNAFVQSPIGDAPARIQVDCRNPKCKLFTVTRDFDDWCSMDVVQWGCEELPGWGASIAALAAAQDAAQQPPRTLCDLVESHIRHEEGTLWEIVLRDFREQLARTLPYMRRDFAARWLHVYTRRGA